MCLTQIDPKRAIPRNEERSTDKLFVRNIPPGVTQPMLQDYFGKFGMLTDCTLMMDRDTRQHRGFGFVTFKDEVTVDRVVNNQPYTIFGQQVCTSSIHLHTRGLANVCVSGRSKSSARHLVEVKKAAASVVVEAEEAVAATQPSTTATQAEVAEATATALVAA